MNLFIRILPNPAFFLPVCGLVFYLFIAGLAASSLTSLTIADQPSEGKSSPASLRPAVSEEWQPGKDGHATLTLKEVMIMLRFSLLFLVVAIVAGVFGFAGIVEAAAGIAKVLFVLFLILFIVSFFMGRRSKSGV